MKRCPTCNRTYADEALTFCLADGMLLSAPYDPQATEVFPKMQATTASSPQVSPSSQSPAPLPRRNRTLWLYAIAALLFLIAGLWWVQRPNKEPQPAATAANSSTVTSPTPAPEQTKDTMSKPSSPTPTPAQQPSPVVMQAPTATPAQNSEEFIVRLSSDNAARLEEIGGSTPRGLESGYITKIYAEVGHKYEGTTLMDVKAFVTSPQFHDDGTITNGKAERTIRVWLKKPGTVVEILVKENQRIYPDDALMILRKN